MLLERARYDMNVARFTTAVAELASRDRNAREDADRISLTLHIHLLQHRAELGPATCSGDGARRTPGVNLLA